MKKILFINLLFGFGLLNCADGGKEKKDDRFKTFCRVQRVVDVARTVAQTTLSEEKDGLWFGGGEVYHDEGTAGAILLNRRGNFTSLVTPWGRMQLYGSNVGRTKDFMELARRLGDIKYQGQDLSDMEYGMMSLYGGGPRDPFVVVGADGSKTKSSDFMSEPAMIDLGNGPNSYGYSEVSLVRGTRMITDIKEQREKLNKEGSIVVPNGHFGSVVYQVLGGGSDDDAGYLPRRGVDWEAKDVEWRELMERYNRDNNVSTDGVVPLFGDEG